MRRSPHISLFGIFALLIVMQVACNVVSDTNADSELTIMVRDTAGTPVIGARVSTNPATHTHFTDDSGYAIFSEIKTGQYIVQVAVGDSLSDQKNIKLTKQPQMLTFEMPVEETVNLTVSHIDGISLENATVTTIPKTSSMTLDAEGHATFSVPVGKYTFVITRGNASAESTKQLISYAGGSGHDISLMINRQSPVISITNIDDITEHSIHDLTFMATCSDFEDGSLPARSIMWYSDIDGYLGYGEQAFIGRMSNGPHTIMLKVKDSDGLEQQCSEDINLYSYIRDSFFPTRYHSSWSYSLTPETFKIDDELHGVDNYELTEYNVSIISDNIRSASLRYCSNQTSWYQYKVNDYFTCSHDTVYVTKTIEYLDMWNSADSNIPETFNTSIIITSTFDEKYPLLIDYIDARMNDDVIFSTTATVDWKVDTVMGSTLHDVERIDFTTKTAFLGLSQLMVDGVRCDAAHMQITQNDITNNLFLAKGYGIYTSYVNIQGQDVQSKMTETNLKFYQDEKVYSDIHSTAIKPAFITNSPADNSIIPHDIREIVDSIRRISPRF